MTVRASCGHVLGDDEGARGMEGLGFPVSLKSWDHEGRTVTFATYCNWCRSEAEFEGLLLGSEEDESAWLSGRMPDPQAA